MLLSDDTYLNMELHSNQAFVYQADTDNYHGQIVEDFQLSAGVHGSGIVTHVENTLKTFDSNGNTFKFEYNPQTDDLTIEYVDGAGNHNEVVYQYQSGMLTLESFKTNGAVSTLIPNDVQQQMVVPTEMSNFVFPVPVSLDNGVSIRVERGVNGMNWEAIDVDYNDAGAAMSRMVYGFDDAGTWQGSAYTNTSHNLEYLNPIYFDNFANMSATDLLKAGYRVSLGAIGGLMTGQLSKTQANTASSYTIGANFYNENAQWGTHSDWHLVNGDLDTSNRYITEIENVGVDKILANMKALYGRSAEGIAALAKVKNVINSVTEYSAIGFAPLQRAYDDAFAVKMNEAQGILTQQNQAAQTLFNALQQKVDAHNNTIINNLNTIKAATIDQAEVQYQQALGQWAANGGLGAQPNKQDILRQLVDAHYAAHSDLYKIDKDPFKANSTTNPTADFIDIKQYVYGGAQNFAKLTDPTNFVDDGDMYAGMYGGYDPMSPTGYSYAPYILAFLGDSPTEGYTAQHLGASVDDPYNEMYNYGFNNGEHPDQQQRHLQLCQQHRPVGPRH
ncbi:MAG: hypothetical protein R2857_10610 [Vampirovibrionales bacterium]